MPIREFSHFDVGNHYIKLLAEGVDDKDIGECLRRWAEEFGVVGADSKDGALSYGVMAHNDVDCENEDMVASIYDELDDVEDDDYE